jgi:hypothetical protein
MAYFQYDSSTRFDSFRTSMEKGADQENLKRAPLCGKLHYTTTTKQEPLCLSLFLSLSVSLRTGRDVEPRLRPDYTRHFRRFRCLQFVRIRGDSS